MPLDPLDLFAGTGASLIRRIVGYLLYGWVGIVLGRIAVAFEKWQDLLNPWRVFQKDLLLGGDVEALLLILWPVLVPLALIKVPWLLLLFIPLIAFSFFVIVFAEEPSPLWGWALVLGISATPLAVMHESAGTPSWFMLAFEWVGLVSIGWWLHQRHHGPLESPFEPLPEDNEGTESEEEHLPRVEPPPPSSRL